MLGTYLDTLFAHRDRRCCGGDSVLFLGGVHHAFLAQFKSVYVYQPFKPWADGFSGTSCVLLNDVPVDGKYDLGLVNLPKQKRKPNTGLRQHWKI